MSVVKYVIFVLLIIYEKLVCVYVERTDFMHNTVCKQFKKLPATLFN